jgi:hypothetical protein
MTVEDVYYIYGTLEIEKIKREAYTNNNHSKFMNSFGLLIKGIKLSKLGKGMSIFIGIL